jgi:hypothetical protein
MITSRSMLSFIAPWICGAWPTSSVGKETKFRPFKTNGDAKRWAALQENTTGSKLVNFEPQVELSSTGKL